MCTLLKFYHVRILQYDNLLVEQKSVHAPLTRSCWVHSNVYGLGNIHWIRYQTAVDPFHSTSSAVQKYLHMTSGSVDIPLGTWTGNSSFIGEEPVPYSLLPCSISIRTSATSSLVSHAEQGIITFTNVLQEHNTVVLVCSISDWEPDICTCTWEGWNNECQNVDLFQRNVNAMCKAKQSTSFWSVAVCKYGGGSKAWFILSSEWRQCLLWVDRGGQGSLRPYLVVSAPFAGVLNFRKKEKCIALGTHAWDSFFNLRPPPHTHTSVYPK